MVRNHHAVDRLGGMAGPPANHDNHDAAETVLVENVPQRFRFSRKVRDQLHAASVPGWFGEAVDAMLERPVSGGIEVHSIGERGGCSVAICPMAPFSTRHRTLGILPASISGWITFQSAASHPTSSPPYTLTPFGHCRDSPFMGYFLRQRAAALPADATGGFNEKLAKVSRDTGRLRSRFGCLARSRSSARHMVGNRHDERSTGPAHRHSPDIRCSSSRRRLRRARLSHGLERNL